MTKQTAFLATVVLITVVLVGAVSFLSLKSLSPKTTKTPEPEIILGAKLTLLENKQFGFKLWYPATAQLRQENLEGFLPATASGTAGIFLPESLFAGTNLGEAAVIIGVSHSLESLSKCQQADVGEKEKGTVAVNGQKFYVFESADAAAGNIYESKIYRTIKNGQCYELVEMLHSGNIYNYPTGTIKEFDKPKFFSILEKIATTFVFTDNASIKVKAFFSNNNLDPEVTCVKVFPVNREILKTPAVGMAALRELIAGPTSAEKRMGYGTVINPGVVVQKLTIASGVARVDFNEELERQVGGSCRVSAIRSQIEETLKQFSTVKEVIISINGRTQDILQP